MKEYKVGYTQGVFDMFHIGHLNLINNAKKRCDYLIVGVNSDHLVEDYKNRSPVIKENDRAEIVRNLKAVDKCIIVNTLDKMAIYEKIRFDAVFIGSDWKGNERWIQTENDLAQVNADVVYLDYTPNVSSTCLREEKENSVE